MAVEWEIVGPLIQCSDCKASKRRSVCVEGVWRCLWCWLKKCNLG